MTRPRCLTPGRLGGKPLPLRLLLSAECSEYLAKNSSFFGLGILESRSQRSAVIFGACRLQHRDNGREASAGLSWKSSPGCRERAAFQWAARPLSQAHGFLQLWGLQN